MSESAEPAANALLTAVPEGVKAVNLRGDDLEPLFNMISFTVVELTAQFVPKEGSPGTSVINQKLGIGNIVFLCEPVKERRHEIGPAAAHHVDLQ